MFSDDAIDYVEDLFTNPLFRKWFLEFFSKMQKEGIQAAKRFWNLSHQGDGLIPKAPEIFEKLIDFYLILGFVPRKRHEIGLRENDRLKEENERFMETLKELRGSIYDDQKNAKEAWEEIMDRQIEINLEAEGAIRDFFRQMKGGRKRNSGSLYTTRVLWEEVTVDKGRELFDAWAKTAKDFLEIGMKLQKQLLEDWTEATEDPAGDLSESRR